MKLNPQIINYIKSAHRRRSDASSTLYYKLRLYLDNPDGSVDLCTLIRLLTVMVLFDIFLGAVIAGFASCMVFAPLGLIFLEPTIVTTMGAFFFGTIAWATAAVSAAAFGIAKFVASLNLGKPNSEKTSFLKECYKAWKEKYCPIMTVKED